MTAKENNHQLIQEISNRFCFNRKGYYIKEIDYDYRRWITCHKDLRDEYFAHHFEGNGTYGVRLLQFTKCIGLDIDFHRIREQNPFYFLAGKKEADFYHYIVTSIGFYPSMVFRSHKQGGLHLYYFIDKETLLNALHSFFKETLLDEVKAKFIELLPNDKKCLRLPYNRENEGKILDVKTLEVIENTGRLSYIAFFDAVSKQANVYNHGNFINPIIKKEIDIINKKKVIENFKKSEKFFQSNQTNQYRYTRYQSIYKHKLQQGVTNDYILNTCYNAFINGITEKVCFDYITKDYQEKRIIKNNDTTQQRLKLRISTCYRNLKNRKLITIKISQENNLFTFKRVVEAESHAIYSLLVDDYLKIKINPTSKTLKKDTTKIKNGLKKFLYELIKWNNTLQNDSYENLKEIEKIYSIKKMAHRVKKEKLLPIPSLLARKWLRRYKTITDLMLKKELLHLIHQYHNPHQRKEYEEMKGSCLYYKLSKRFCTV